MPEDINAPEAAAAANDELTQKVLRIVAETQRKDITLVKIDSSFEELGIDSMDGVNIVFALENEFDVNVPDDEVKNIHSIRDMVEGIRKLVAARAAGAGEAAPA
jgi:acyl carrier protein